MPKKPGNYGLKFWILVDAKTHFCYNASSYLDKDGDKSESNFGVKVIKDQVKTSSELWA